MAALTTVVIPARNAAATLALQLDALAGQDYDGPWEVVLVDDGSTDGTVTLARAYAARLPSLRIVTGGGHGVSHARNLGAAAAAGDHILCCDADDIVTPGWLGALTTALDDADVVGGRLETGRLNAWRTPQPPRRQGALPTHLGYLQYAIGCNMGFRRALFDALDGFDESFPPGCEDTDFSWRAQQAGYRLGFAPEAVVHYRLRANFRAVLRQQYAYAWGAARLRAVHTRKGAIASEPARVQARRLAGHVRNVLRVRQLVRAADRYSYVRSAGWLAGSVKGLVAERVVP